MKRVLLLLTVFAAGILWGCGDPAPSTKLAPDQTAPDVGKMTPEQIEAMHKANDSGDRR